MIHKKYYRYVFVAFMAFGMTVVMTFTTMIVNEGFSRHFIALWLDAIALGFTVAYPTALMITPLAASITKKLVS